MSDLTPKQEKAIAALLSSRTISDAATAIGVNERQIYRWLADDRAFAEAYRAARRDAVQQATARLQQASASAVDTLISLLASSRASIQLGAARTILEFAVQAIELDDLAARLDALEGRYAQNI